MGNALIGIKCKVTIGDDKVVGIGNWHVSRGTVDSFDASQFGDNWEMLRYGIKRDASISFNGNFFPDDNDGQGAVERAYIQGTDLPDIRFYYNDDDFLGPNQVVGYFSDSLPVGAGTPVSTVRVTNCEVSIDKSGLGSISFTAKCSGAIVYPWMCLADYNGNFLIDYDGSVLIQ